MVDLLPAAGIVLGITGLAGGAAGYFKKSTGDSIIAYQAREIELRDGSIARLEKSEAALTAERDSLKAENKRLWDKAQGNPQLIELTHAIKSQGGELKKLTEGFTRYVKKQGNNQ